MVSDLAAYSSTLGFPMAGGSVLPLSVEGVVTKDGLISIAVSPITAHMPLHEARRCIRDLEREKIFRRGGC